MSKVAIIGIVVVSCIAVSISIVIGMYYAGTGTAAAADATNKTNAPTKTTGRYVKISQPTINCMNIGDVEIMSGGVNVAKGKTVTQSSTYASPFPVVNLVDEVFTNFAHTSCNEAGWMTVDLASDMGIDSIKVTNRADCCSGRIIGAKVEILDSTNKVIYTSDAFKGKNGETAPTTGAEMTGFTTYTMTPPGTAVKGT